MSKYSKKYKTHTIERTKQNKYYTPLERKDGAVRLTDSGGGEGRRRRGSKRRVNILPMKKGGSLKEEYLIKYC